MHTPKARAALPLGMTLCLYLCWSCAAAGTPMPFPPCKLPQSLMHILIAHLDGTPGWHERAWRRLLRAPVLSTGQHAPLRALHPIFPGACKADICSVSEDRCTTQDIRPRSHAKFFIIQAKILVIRAKFLGNRQKLCGHTQNFLELRKKFEQRIGVHDWLLFFGNSKRLRIAMGTSPNDFPLNKMPLTQAFAWKPAYLHAFTVSQDGEA